MLKKDAFVAKIVNTRLTKIFMAIFVPDERLPSSATLFRQIAAKIYELPEPRQSHHLKLCNPSRKPATLWPLCSHLSIN